MPHLKDFVHEGALHSLVIAAASKALFQHRLALTAEAAADPGARQQQVWMQYDHACATQSCMTVSHEALSDVAAMLSQWCQHCNCMHLTGTRSQLAHVLITPTTALINTFTRVVATLMLSATIMIMHKLPGTLLGKMDAQQQLDTCRWQHACEKSGLIHAHIRHADVHAMLPCSQATPIWHLQP